ncbi:CHAT domain-containing protein [Myceligenerans xiligouense]|uniref:CHAT domain-containing protein n=1 Tax=Myceligenerans xiligouense TaxID=253184 RepID=A0A3N4Z6J8_9MICO|nr:CHAT domain-containing protein [Myceligenerans xiligouense]RPF20912.1 CHAT domain-containing protein [Myceligenerans xiligouense]
MRYPGLAPAGSGPPGSGWALAGSDVAAAERALRRPTTGAGAVRLAEVLRRRARLAEALRVLDAARAAGTDRPLLCLAEGNVRWNDGDLPRAVAAFRAADEAWAAVGDRDGRLAAQLGIARCERMTVGRRGGRAALDVAQRTAVDVGDVDLLADLRRERAAWALLAGEHDAALSLAQAAAETHRSTGDRYLAGLADILVARAWHAGGDEDRAIGLLHEARARGVEIGSYDLEQLSVIYLGNFLQRAAAPDSPRWHAAETMLREEIDRATDPITRAEMLLPLAHLHLAAGEFDRAQAELDEYLRLYTLVGGNRISTGNFYKARARLELARGGGSGAMRMVRRTPRLIAALRDTRRNLRRAALAYRDAGLEPGRRSIEWHLGVLDLMAAGKPPTSHVTAAGNRFDAALRRLVVGEALRASQRWADARTAYAAAEADAVACGSTVMAVAATACRAEVAVAAGDTGGALDAIRSMLRHTEAIRAAVAVGPARGNIGAVVRSHYERAAVLAARLGDADLVLELVERLRTERLAGLLRSGTQQLPEEVRDLLARIDDTNTALLNASAGVRPGRSAPEIEDLAALTPEALAARSESLYAELGRRTSELFAVAAGAVPVDWDAVATLRQDILALVTVPDGDGEVVITVWRSADGDGAVTVTEVDDTLASLRDTLVRPDSAGLLRRVDLMSSDLEPIRRLLPSAFTAAATRAATPIDLVIIPTAWLWAVPFAGVPLSEDGSVVLVEAADLVLAPSLRFFVEATTRTRPDTVGGLGAVSWRAPDAGISAPEIDALRHHAGTTVQLRRPEDVRETFVRGGSRYRTAVLAAHGNREPGLAQAVVDGNRPVLSASDYLDGDRFPPRFLSVASCHSGYPRGEDPHEPLGLALAALTAGVEQVVSSTFEMDAYEGPATDTLRQVYTELARDGDVPAVLCRILREGLRARSFAGEPLYRWAVLSVIGTHPWPSA